VRIDRRSRAWLKLHEVVFVVLALVVSGLVLAVAERYPLQADLTHRGSRSISEASARLAGRLQGAVHVTAFARENPYTRGATRELVERYRRFKPDLTLEFVDPDRAPERVRSLGITRDGEMVVELAGRTARVRQPTEAALTNALVRVAQPRERWVVYLRGHGERDLLGEANHHLGRFGKRLEGRGYRVQGIELARTGSVPANASLVVISAPSAPMLEAEVELLLAWIEDGGNVLWLGEPGPVGSLAPLAAALGIEQLPGTVVEPQTRLYGLDDPALALSSTYPAHPATAGFEVLTVYPRAAGLRVTAPPGWAATPIVLTSEAAWSESGTIEGTVGFDDGADARGPLGLAVALERALEPSEVDGVTLTRRQRVVVVGDGDFLSNTYLGNVGNADLGLALVHWLAGDDTLVDIPRSAPPDGRLELSHLAAATIALGSLFAVPALFAGLGAWVWLRRRHR